WGVGVTVGDVPGVVQAYAGPELFLLGRGGWRRGVTGCGMSRQCPHDERQADECQTDWRDAL
ncbi:MAG: hypothetical protein PVF45_13225, partial [Anaerolineae bacterium]